MIITDPINPGNLPRDILKELNFKEIIANFPKRLEAVNKIESILKGNNISEEDAFVQAFRTAPYAYVWVNDYAKEGKADKIITLLKLNGAKEEGPWHLLMDNVKILVAEGSYKYPYEQP